MRDLSRPWLLSMRLYSEIKKPNPNLLPKIEVPLLTWAEKIVSILISVDTFDVSLYLKKAIDSENIFTKSHQNRYYAKLFHFISPENSPSIL